jgi:hypothetical protein
MRPLERQRGTRTHVAVEGEVAGGTARRGAGGADGEDKGDTPMMRLRQDTRSVVLLGGLLVGVLVGTSLATALEVGEQAPDFTLASTTGESVALRQYREKQWVLLEFYIAGGIPAEHPT